MLSFRIFHEEWIEHYHDGKVHLKQKDGSDPTHLYRVMSHDEYAAAKAKGHFHPRPGERIHASETPQKQYGNPGGSVTVKFQYHKDDGWRPKWGDKLYAVTDKPIPFSRATLAEERIVRFKEFIRSTT